MNPNGGSLTADSRVAWFSETAIYETTTHTDSYHQVAFHKLDSVKFFDKNLNDAMISIVFYTFIATLPDYEYSGQTP